VTVVSVPFMGDWSLKVSVQVPIDSATDLANLIRLGIAVLKNVRKPLETFEASSAIARILYLGV
jgi:hypothetical protein